MSGVGSVLIGSECGVELHNPVNEDVLLGLLGHTGNWDHNWTSVQCSGVQWSGVEEMNRRA